jgi:hypothetical protein
VIELTTPSALSKVVRTIFLARGHPSLIARSARKEGKEASALYSDNLTSDRDDY